jgi:hypothetical protein
VFLVVAQEAMPVKKAAVVVAVELDIWAAAEELKMIAVPAALEEVVVEAVQVMWEAVSLY